MDKEKFQYMLENNYNCSQAILCYFADKYGLDENTAKNLVSGMDCGMGQAKTCGAVTSAYLVLGLDQADGSDSKKSNIKDKMKIFNDSFLEKHKSIECLELLGLDISTDEGMVEAFRSGLIGEVCVKCMSDSISILEEIIGEDIE